MKSIKQMVDRIEGLIDTNDLSIWENGFVKNVIRLVENRKGDTTLLTSKQVEVIERIFKKHFGD